MKAKVDFCWYVHGNFKKGLDMKINSVGTPHWIFSSTVFQLQSGPTPCKTLKTNLLYKVYVFCSVFIFLTGCESITPPKGMMNTTLPCVTTDPLERKYAWLHTNKKEINYSLLGINFNLELIFRFNFVLCNYLHCTSDN